MRAVGVGTGRVDWPALELAAKREALRSGLDNLLHGDIRVAVKTLKFRTKTARRISLGVGGRNILAAQRVGLGLDEPDNWLMLLVMGNGGHLISVQETKPVVGQFGFDFSGNEYSLPPVRHYWSPKISDGIATYRGIA